MTFFIGQRKISGSITLIKGRQNILVDTGSPWDKDLLLQGFYHPQRLKYHNTFHQSNYYFVDIQESKFVLQTNILITVYTWQWKFAVHVNPWIEVYTCSIFLLLISKQILVFFVNLNFNFSLMNTGTVYPDNYIGIMVSDTGTLFRVLLNIL